MIEVIQPHRLTYLGKEKLYVERIFEIHSKNYKS